MSDKEEYVFKATGTINENDLPEGVIGQIEAVFVRYNTPDADGEMFAPGCLTKTVQQRVASGKVKLHATWEGEGHNTKDLNALAGQVIKVVDSDTEATLTANILDTPGGQKLYKYAKACLANGIELGVSLGASIVKAGRELMTNGKMGRVFREIALNEVSVVGDRASVPGARITVVKTATVDELTNALSVLCSDFEKTDVTKAMTEVLAKMVDVVEKVEAPADEEVVQEAIVDRIVEALEVVVEAPVHLSWDERMAIFREKMQ